MIYAKKLEIKIVYEPGIHSRVKTLKKILSLYMLSNSCWNNQKVEIVISPLTETDFNIPSRLEYVAHANNTTQISLI